MLREVLGAAQKTLNPFRFSVESRLEVVERDVQGTRGHICHCPHTSTKTLHLGLAGHGDQPPSC